MHQQKDRGSNISCESSKNNSQDLYVTFLKRRTLSFQLQSRYFGQIQPLFPHKKITVLKFLVVKCKNEKKIDVNKDQFSSNMKIFYLYLNTFIFKELRKVKLLLGKSFLCVLISLSHFSFPFFLVPMATFFIDFRGVCLLNRDF